MSKALENVDLLRTVSGVETADDVLTKDADAETVVWAPIPAAAVPDPPTTLNAACTISSQLVGFRDIPTTTTFERGKMNVITANATLNTSDMAAGYTFSVYNNSAGSLSIIQGAGVTMRLGGSTTTGTRTLAARGLATIWCLSGTECIVIGAGVS